MIFTSKIIVLLCDSKILSFYNISKIIVTQACYRKNDEYAFNFHSEEWNINTTQCLNNSAKSGELKYLYEERSVLTLGSQVPSAYNKITKIAYSSNIHHKNISYCLLKQTKSRRQTNVCQRECFFFLNNFQRSKKREGSRLDLKSCTYFC